MVDCNLFTLYSLLPLSENRAISFPGFSVMYGHRTCTEALYATTRPGPEKPPASKPLCSFPFWFEVEKQRAVKPQMKRQWNKR